MLRVSFPSASWLWKDRIGGDLSRMFPLKLCFFQFLIDPLPIITFRLLHCCPPFLYHLDNPLPLVLFQLLRYPASRTSFLSSSLFSLLDTVVPDLRTFAFRPETAIERIIPPHVIHRIAGLSQQTSQFFLWSRILFYSTFPTTEEPYIDIGGSLNAHTMTTPTDEKLEPQYPTSHLNPNRTSSDEDNTVVGDGSLNTSQHGQTRFRSYSHLTVETQRDYLEPPNEIKSPSHSQSREQAKRLDDDLAMLQAERQVSQSHLDNQDPHDLEPKPTVDRTRSRRQEPVDDFDAATNPLHERAAVYRPPENPDTKIAKFFKYVHGSSFLLRYFVYITPPVLVILIPLLLGIFLFKGSSVGGVQMWWFCIWLEIVWLTLWAGRVSHDIGLIGVTLG